MAHNWKEITSDLYSKIAPIKGYLHSQIDSSFISKRKLENIWIDFEMNDFTYMDPFYGEQKSTDPFNMYLSLWDILVNYQLDTIFKIENLEIEGDKKNILGAFSNSLHFLVPFFKFGKIEDLKVPFEMQYILTNSVSYGMMNGTIDDHSTVCGCIKVDLQINELLVLVSKDRRPNEIIVYLDKNIYDSDNIREANDTGREYRDYHQYWIPYKI